MLNAAVKSRALPHVIVVGNEKGGSGKTTIAMHIAVALMKSGQRLATIDLDSRQRTLTHYIENRRAWARRCHVDLELPTHLTVAYAEGARVDENEAAEFADFGKAVAAIEHRHDFVVIDTPPHDSYLMRLAAALADWVVVRNRISPSGSSAKPVLCDSLQELALEVGFRVATGFHERPVYRDLFPRGLTALDALCDL